MDDDAVRQLNREGWNRRAEEGDVWSLAMDSETIAKARKGDWQVVLTPTKPVPREWFGEIAGKDILGLASAGGQQCPIFAAAGARVTSFDASDRQLAAGLMPTGLYEDCWQESAAPQLFPPFVATRAVKP